MNKPSTLKQVFAAAAPMFKNKDVISVQILSTFGFIRVYRNGAMFHCDEE